MEEEKKVIASMQSVERALKILEAISRNGSMGLNDLHKAFGVNKASLLRLAQTLVANGYLEKHPQSGNYRLTLKPYIVGMSSMLNQDTTALIHATLKELNQKTKRIAQFCVEENNENLCLQSVGYLSKIVPIYTNIGRRSQLYNTSCGKAMLATYSNSQIMEKWKLFVVKQHTENTITSVRDLILQLNDVRRNGYAVDREEQEYHVFCVGAVLHGASNVPLGALSLSGETLTPEEEAETSRILIDATNELSRLLGYVSDSQQNF